MAKELRKESVPTEQEISQRAHEIYVKSGSVPGHDLENWLTAEKQLTQERGATAAAPQSSTSKSGEEFSQRVETKPPAEPRSKRTHNSAGSSKSARKQQVGILPGGSSSQRIS